MLEYINPKNLSKKAKMILAGGSLILVGGIVGCTAKTVSENNKQNNNVEVATTDEVATTEAKVEEVNTNNEETNVYEQIDTMENDVVEFAQTYLANGAFEDVTDENKIVMSERFTDSYIIMNVKNMGKSIAILDQNMELMPAEMIESFMKFSRQVGNYAQIQTPETAFDFSKYIMNETDVEFINNLSNEIAYFNVAESAEERQSRIENLINIKESLKDSYELKKYDYSTIYVAINMLIDTDATAKAYGSAIFTDEDDKNQVYNSFYNEVCSEYGEEIGDARQSLESLVMKLIDRNLSDMIAKTQNMNEESYDAYYSYNEVVKRVAEKLLGYYKAPEQTNIDKENSIREATSKAIDAKNIGKTTTKVVDKKDVPKDQREKDKTTYSTEDNGKDLKDVDTKNAKVEDGNKIKVENSDSAYTKGESAGRTAGSAAAYSKQTSTGKIPSKISSAPTPSVPSDCKAYSDSYISGYQYGYVAGWNDYVNSANKSRSKATTEFIKAKDSKEEKVSESETRDIKSNEKTTEAPVTEAPKTEAPTTEAPTTENSNIFIPIDGEEEIIEESEEYDISELKANLIKLRNSYIEQFANSYVNAFYEEQENTRRI